MRQTEPPAQTLPAIQYLRGVAAMMVVVGHTMMELRAVEAFGDPAFAVEWNYGFGVDLFFVISGFIMMYTAGDGFGNRSKQRRFLFARLTRIAPLYWLVTTAYLAIAFIAPSGLNAVAIDARTIVGSYLFIPVANPVGVVLPLVAVGYTLNYEMLFYAIFTAAMVLPRTPGRRVVVTTLFAVPAAGWLLQPTSPTLRFWADSIIIEFAFGALLGMFVARLAAAPRRLAWLFLSSGLALYLVPYAVNVSDLWPRVIVSGIPAALIVAGAICFDVQQRTIDIRFLRAIGNGSYSLYLTHPFVVRAARIAWNRLLPSGPTWAFCSLTVLAAIVIGLIVAALIELPLHRWTKASSRRMFVAPTTVPGVAR